MQQQQMEINNRCDIKRLLNNRCDNNRWKSTTDAKLRDYIKSVALKSTIDATLKDYFIAWKSTTDAILMPWVTLK